MYLCKWNLEVLGDDVRNFLFFFAVLAIIGLSFSVSAATITNTVINLTGSNTTINITNTWTYDSLRVDDTSFTVFNLTQDVGVGSDTISFNYTGNNQRLLGTDFPYYTVSEPTSKKIVSLLLLNITTYADVTDCNISTVTYTSHNAVYSQAFSAENCSNGFIKLDIQSLEVGANNELSIDYFVEAIQNTLSSIKTGVSTFIGFIAIIGIVIGLAIVLIIFNGLNTGEVDVDFMAPAAGLFIVIIVILVIGFIIVNALIG